MHTQQSLLFCAIFCMTNLAFTVPFFAQSGDLKLLAHNNFFAHDNKLHKNSDVSFRAYLRRIACHVRFLCNLPEDVRSCPTHGIFSNAKLELSCMRAHAHDIETNGIHHISVLIADLDSRIRECGTMTEVERCLREAGCLIFHVYHHVLHQCATRMEGQRFRSSSLEDIAVLSKIYEELKEAPLEELFTLLDECLVTYVDILHGALKKRYGIEYTFKDVLRDPWFLGGIICTVVANLAIRWCIVHYSGWHGHRS